MGNTCLDREHSRSMSRHRTSVTRLAQSHDVVERTSVLLVSWHHPCAMPLVSAVHMSNQFAAAVQADQGYCTDIRDEYVRHFLYGEFVTGGGGGGGLPAALSLGSGLHSH